MFTALTWNCEGIKNNFFFLKNALSKYKVDLACLSEPQIYQCDAKHILKNLEGEYCWHLNSDDLLDQELPLVKSRAHGGTLMLWSRELDPYIEVIPTTTSAILILVMNIPGVQTSIHVTLYMPTHSKDSEFVSDLADLRKCIDSLLKCYTNPVLYIRGDSNVNSNNTTRVTLLHQLLRDYSLNRVNTGHNTYHHFVGHGLYDSDIDVLLHSEGSNISETVTDIICKNDNPDIFSHHDAIISSFTIPGTTLPQPGSPISTAPKLEHSRTKIFWTDEGQAAYYEVVAPYLCQIRDTWLDPSSPMCMSVLLSITNSIMQKFACMTNEYSVSGPRTVGTSSNIPKAIRLVTNKMKKAHRIYRRSKDDREASKTWEIFVKCRKNFKKTVRQLRIKASLQRYQRLDQIFSNQKAAYAYIRSCKKTSPKSIEELHVGDQVYTGASVCDGFYASMTALKTVDLDVLKADPDLSIQFTNYEIIRELCKNQEPIPTISVVDSTKILKKLKKNVSDFYSITSLHYLHAGHEGLLHFNALINALITNISNSSIAELNTAYGNILYKGHRKKRTLDRSYRTISSCPFLAKSVDFYLRELYSDCWHSRQACTQFQGPGSSHELASLLVTEVIQYSLDVSNKPVFILVLDAQSAFDRCLRQILCAELFKAGVDRSAIRYMDNRLANKKTVYEWDGVMMGPAEDVTGFEQGGINSSDYYKLYNNEQLKTAQSSCLGADIGSSVISAVGQADDVLLISNDIHNLHLLVMMTEDYCKKFRVKLEPKKTKLLGYGTKFTELSVKLASQVNPITIDGVSVAFESEAEHVGVIRNTSGNMPNVLHRVTEHKKSLGAVLSTGMARGHRGSPAAALRVHQLHCTPVLFSGLASLVLTRAEIDVIDKHYQRTIQNLQRLYPKTPRAITYFLAGSLPGEAILHMKQFSLFSKICHLPDNPLNQHGRYVLSTLSPSSSSWFHQVRDICLQYSLPHPITLLENPYPKLVFKKLIKEKVTEYWQHTLAAECITLSSLKYFNPHFASLSRPHTMWTSSAGNSYECSKSTILAQMTSGRYRTEMLCRFWSNNRNGYCLAETCHDVQGDIVHLLVVCPALLNTRLRLHGMWWEKTANCPPLHQLILKILGSSDETLVRFILDSTSFPEIVYLKQMFGQELEDRVLYLTRTWAYAIHREKLRLLGRWPEPTSQQQKSRHEINEHTDTTKNDNTDNATSNEHNNYLLIAGVPRPAVAAYRCGPVVPEHNSSSQCQQWGRHQPGQEPASMAVMGPEEDGLHGCGGHAGALDHLAGVCGGGCVGRVQCECRGDHSPYNSRTPAIPTTRGSHWETTHWVSCGNTITIPHHTTSSVTSPWHTIV